MPYLSRRIISPFFPSHPISKSFLTVIEFRKVLLFETYYILYRDRSCSLYRAGWVLPRKVTLTMEENWQPIGTSSTNHLRHTQQMMWLQERKQTSRTKNNTEPCLLVDTKENSEKRHLNVVECTMSQYSRVFVEELPQSIRVIMTNHWRADKKPPYVIWRATLKFSSSKN